MESCGGLRSKAVFDHRVGQDIDQIAAVDPAPHMDGQALPSVFVDQIEHAHSPSIMRERADEVIGPDMILMLRAQPYARAIIEPQPPSRLLLLGNLQPFAAPDSLHSILPHVPAGFAQLDRDPSIAVPPIAVSQGDDRPGQCVFVVPLCGLVSAIAKRGSPGTSL